MKYTKPALNHGHLADKLLAGGLVADRDILIRRLEVTSYFRLSGYLYPFRDGDEDLKPGTTLESVERLYDFDRKLRGLTLDAIESVEVQVRSALSHRFALDHGPFAYLDRRNFPNFEEGHGDFVKWEKKLREQIDRGRQPKGKEEFVLHFYQKYGDEEELLPIWMIAELMDFGSTLSFFRGVSDAIRKDLAAKVGQPEEVVLSWLLALNSIRNRCAHHARLWNWTIGYSVLVPARRKNPAWHEARIPNNRLGIILTLCRYWLDRIGLRREWGRGLTDLFDEYPEIRASEMGLPEAWRELSLWKEV